MTGASKEELLERYESTGDEDAFVRAKALYERALADAPEPSALRDYGYLLECHGRYAIGSAVEHYEHAIELAPGEDKVRYHLMSAKAALRQAEDAIALYEHELAAAPGELRWHRLLATAYLLAGAHEKAAPVVEAGLALAAGDRPLLAMRGEVKAARGDVDGALADWRAALDPHNHDIGSAYSSAFLLAREGRHEEAIEAWRYILEFNETRGYELQAQWPRREIERLEAVIAAARG